MSWKSIYKLLTYDYNTCILALRISLYSLSFLLLDILLSRPLNSHQKIFKKKLDFLFPFDFLLITMKPSDRTCCKCKTEAATVLIRQAYYCQ